MPKVNYAVEYFNVHDQRWSGTYSPVSPLQYRTEADRLAAKRSGKSYSLYRVRSGKNILSYWKRGNEVPAENVKV